MKTEKCTQCYLDGLKDGKKATLKEVLNHLPNSWWDDKKSVDFIEWLEAKLKEVQKK